MTTSSHWHLERLQEQLHREIAWTINYKMRDPRISGIVTVMAVKLSPDMRNASVSISIYGSDEQKLTVLKVLNGATAFIQNTAASKIKIKNFPKLHFRLDTSLDQSEHINSILEQIKDDLV